jgi:hypothetical protein
MESEAPKRRTWYQPTVRDQFMLAGMFIGIAAQFGVGRLTHPFPSIAYYFPLIG